MSDVMAFTHQVSAPKLVSLLLPTRGRPEHLRATLQSLQDTARDHDNIEVLLKVDDDDIDTVRFLQISTWKMKLHTAMGPRGAGYADLHHYVNHLCSVSQGRFLFLWNDDATMLTQSWDRLLAEHDDGKLCYVKSKISDSRGNDSYLFPIVHRSYYETLGHFSMSPHNDTYVNTLFATMPSHSVRGTNILVRHNALELIQQGDKTSLEGKALWPVTKGAWHSSEVQAAIAVDIAKLQELVKQQA